MSIPVPIGRTSVALVAMSVALATLTACGADAPAETSPEPVQATTSASSPAAEPTTTVSSLEFRESDLTPEVLASLSDAEIVSRMQIPVADYPTVEAWAEQYVLRDNDVMRSGTAPSEIGILYDRGTDAMYSTVDRYVALFNEALVVDPDAYTPSDILHLAVTNAAQAHKNGETYVIREDLESVGVTDGSAEEGAFSVNLVLRRRDNMADLEVTKNEIYQNTGNKLKTLSADADISMKYDVIDSDGLWKVAHLEVGASTRHED